MLAETLATLSTAEKTAWLRLARAENVGPATFHQLVARYGTAEAALDALPALAQRGGRSRPLKVPAESAVEEELDAIGRAGAHLIASVEADYPPLLARINDPPPLLTVAGDPAILQRRAVAIVGARNASANGARFASRLAADLADAGVLVVSGLARGIDGHAHRGALQGGTVAVVAGGFDVVYPPEHQELHRDIIETGAVLSEMPAGTVPQARHFPRRNRIISGMALGTCVVEAAARSGSLITARFAADQGRDVYAVPGFPLDPRAAGTNGLLKDGAILVEDADDILQNLTSLSGTAIWQAEVTDAGDGAASEPVTDGELSRTERECVYDALSAAPVSVDHLVRHTGLTPAGVQAALLELELAGRVDRFADGRIAIRH
ncbi:MAG: DNA-processing protein DprA [Alphaproteobacteria bacterium]|nr:DNA-processing protein DprA [Alphaproteobacteria bacterium]